MSRFLVIGFGHFGSWVARTLLELDHEVIVVERNGDLVDRYAGWASRAVQGDATDPEVLKRAGAASVDAAVVSTGDEFAASILATVALRDLGVSEIYVKVTSQNQARAMEALGVSEAVFPEREAAVRLANSIVSTSVLDYVPVGEKHAIEEMAVPKAWIGRTLRDLALRGRSRVQVVGVRDVLTGAVTVPPDPEAPLKDSDAVFVAGPNEALRELTPARPRRRR